MRITNFFKLGSIDKLAKLVNRSASTIRRWKKEGIPKYVKEKVRKIVEKKTKKKPKPTIVPLTAREKKQRKEQKKLALEEKRRLVTVKSKDVWVKEALALDEYTPNRVTAIAMAIRHRNKKRLLKATGPKERKRIFRAIRAGERLLHDYADGNDYINPLIIQELMDEFNLSEEEATKDIYGFYH